MGKVKELRKLIEKLDGEIKRDSFKINTFRQAITPLYINVCELQKEVDVYKRELFKLENAKTQSTLNVYKLFNNLDSESKQELIDIMLNMHIKD